MRANVCIYRTRVLNVSLLGKNMNVLRLYIGATIWLSCKRTRNIPPTVGSVCSGVNPPEDTTTVLTLFHPYHRHRHNNNNCYYYYYYLLPFPLWDPVVWPVPQLSNKFSLIPWLQHVLVFKYIHAKHVHVSLTWSILIEGIVLDKSLRMIF